MNLVFLFEFKNDVHWVRFVKMPCHIATLPCIIWNTSGIAWYRVIKASVTNHFLRQTLRKCKTWHFWKAFITTDTPYKKPQIKSPFIQSFWVDVHNKLFTIIDKIRFRPGNQMCYLSNIPSTSLLSQFLSKFDWKRYFTHYLSKISHFRN